jgi:hypothetical protein
MCVPAYGPPVRQIFTLLALVAARVVNMRGPPASRTWQSLYGFSVCRWDETWKVLGGFLRPSYLT